MNEIWKNIAGYEGLYEVSSFGRVRSIGFGKIRVLKPGKTNRGYLSVTLCKNGEKKNFSIHRLVATAFIDNPEGKPQVNHKDEDKTNNRIENLEWMTSEENCNYGTRNERVANAISRAVLQSTKDGKFLKEFQSIMEAERKAGINHRHICKCCLGKRKSAGGYVWKYKENLGE